MRRVELPSDCGRGDIAILGLPADDKSSYMRGAASAPAAIREALATDSSNLAAEDGFDLGESDAIKDLGDLPLAGRFDLPTMDVAASAILARGARLVSLGGDHAVTLPLLRAHARAEGRPLAVLHLDAHSDLYADFGGDPHSHASPFARALEEGLVGRLVQVGIRCMTAHLRSQVARWGVEVIDMDAWSRGARPGFDGPFYLSLDLDCLDPAFAPGVSHREPGGLTTREAIDIVARCPGILSGADLVELNPARDPSGAPGECLSAMAAAKLLKEIVARLARDGKSR